MTREQYDKNRPRVECPNCGKLVTKAVFKKHYKACINPNSKLNNKSSNIYKLDHEGLNCKFCTKEFKSRNALIQHELRCPNNPKRKDFSNLSNYVSTVRKGKTKEDLPEIQKQVNTMLQKYSNGYVSPNTGRKIVIDYVYKEHNENEIK